MSQVHLTPPPWLSSRPAEPGSPAGPSGSGLSLAPSPWSGKVEELSALIGGTGLRNTYLFFSYDPLKVTSKSGSPTIATLPALNHAATIADLILDDCGAVTLDQLRFITSTDPLARATAEHIKSGIDTAWSGFRSVFPSPLEDCRLDGSRLFGESPEIDPREHCAAFVLDCERMGGRVIVMITDDVTSKALNSILPTSRER